MTPVQCVLGREHDRPRAGIQTSIPMTIGDEIDEREPLSPNGSGTEGRQPLPPEAETYERERNDSELSGAHRQSILHESHVVDFPGQLHGTRLLGPGIDRAGQSHNPIARVDIDT